MSLRQEEELSANALKQHLCGPCGYLEAEYTPVAADPPDVIFRVVRQDNSIERWGVEITGLFQYADLDGRRVNHLDFHYHIKTLEDRLNAEFASELTRSYSLVFWLPMPFKLFRDLPSRVREYIHSGETSERALDRTEAVETVSEFSGIKPNEPNFVMLEQVVSQYQHVTISGQDGNPGILVVSGIDPTAKLPGVTGMAGDIQESVNDAVGRILEKKLARLKAIEGVDRKILLIWNGFILAEAAEVKKAIEDSAASVPDIDAIFFIDFGWQSVALVADPAKVFSVT